MVCATITRDPHKIDGPTVEQIRDALHAAIVQVMQVKHEDVEMRVRNISSLDRNSGQLAIEIDSGPGKNGWRLVASNQLLLQLNEAVAESVPAQFWKKGKSNIWLRIYAKGASMPVGCPEQMH